MVHNHCKKRSANNAEKSKKTVRIFGHRLIFNNIQKGEKQK